MRRLVSAFVVGPVLLLAGTAAMALGMGRVNTLSELGSPLDFSVALSAEPSDALDLDCIRADVYTGDARVPPAMVRLRLTRRADGAPVALRVSTGTRMDEPVVNVEVVLDCGVRVSRRFVVFIDPPQLSLAEAGGAAAAAGAVAAQRDPAARGVDSAAPPRRARSARPAEGSPSRTVRPGGTGVASSAARQRRAEAAAAARQARATAQAQAQAEPGSRLKLDSAAPTVGTAPLRERAAGSSGAAGVGAPATGAAAAALQSAASAAQTAAAASAAAASGAASSAIAAASAASGSVGGLLSELAAKAEADAQALNAERLRSLEESLARLRTDNQTMQKSMAELQARLQEAEAGRYANPLVYGLLALLGLLVLAVIGLLWRQASLRKESEWLRAAATQGEGPSVANPPQPAVRSMTMPSGAAVLRAGGAAAAAAVVAGGAKARVAADAPDAAAAVVDDEPPPVESPARVTETAIASLATQPVTPAAATGAGAALRPHEKTSIHDPRREVSVEELIDLEQQADFFVVLGQDDAAVELLLGHVQGTGGASPLPYLKLLEIHRRRDERGAYDEVRERFNRRFSAFAPEWDAHSGHDRSLEDYPLVIEHLQSMWRDPAAAMDQLASLLFQRDPTAQTFDLPAYGELLFLYSMARELAEDPGAHDGVDLLLPLDDFGPGSGGAKSAGLVAGGMAVAAAAVAAAPDVAASGATDMSFSPLPGLDELPSIPSLPEQPATYPAPLAYDPPEPRDPGSIDFDNNLLDLNISDEPEEPKGPLSKY